jgi:DNA-binding transcriptional ArsR family regulator
MAATTPIRSPRAAPVGSNPAAPLRGADDGASTPAEATHRGDADVAAVASVLAEPARARILLALGDGRALAASVLAAEAGVAASTASGHLARLVDAGLLDVLPQGRHRYYRLAGPHVGELLEALARVAPAAPVRSLRQGTRAAAVRSARTCYDHLAGGLGVELFAALIENGHVIGGDGRHDPVRSHRDRLSAPGRDVDYRLTPPGRDVLAALGVVLPAPAGDGTIALRYCVDWSEQRHHLSGAVGRALARRAFELGWLRRLDGSRAVRLTAAGRDGLAGLGLSPSAHPDR